MGLRHLAILAVQGVGTLAAVAVMMAVATVAAAVIRQRPAMGRQEDLRQESAVTPVVVILRVRMATLGSVCALAARPATGEGSLALPSIQIRPGVDTP
jgi:hypothetical protein